MTDPQADACISPGAGPSRSSARPAASPRLPAILLICAGTLCLVISDAASKWLVERYAPLQILFVRCLIALPVAALLVTVIVGPGALRSHRPGVHLLRGALSVLATLAFIWSLGRLPLAEATALMFVAPLFLALLAVPILGERPRRADAVALGIGLIGMLLIVRPGTAAFQPAALAALLAALLYALTMIAGRWIDPRDSVWTVLVYVPLVSLALCAFTLGQDWPGREAGDALAFAVSALCGTLGVTLLTQSFRMAPAALVAPFEYTALIWASLLGWTLFGAAPSVWTWAGAAVIAAGSLGMTWVERRRRGTSGGDVEGRASRAQGPTPTS